ncbi:hypothetical protein ACH6EH_07400 [Paenibacillus sp. JSM ZJ436]|uniref:hypothetical protein n=1 Tax=Paenibacillus sp. JSM ZJ436 TaxID=3376190 RepID=UPI0037ACEF2B
MLNEKYMVVTNDHISNPFGALKEAVEMFEVLQNDMMSEGVQEGETYIEIIASTDDFEDDRRVIKKVFAVIDHDRTELSTPREEGMDWDYWAKWVEVEDINLPESCRP